MTARGASGDQPVTRFDVLPGIYKDSLVLMQLQCRLLEQAGVLEAGAAMASEANLELLEAGGLLPELAADLHAEDLLVVVRAESAAAADFALANVGDLLAERGHVDAGSFRPRSLEGALSQLPEARWALVSVPGQHASRVAEDALERGLDVFMYSDNVSGSDEARLKRLAAARGLMLLGPDCGTAIIAGIGLGFANHVRRGPIGLVGGSGTGLQAVSVAIHNLGSGVSQVIGTGGHDLSIEVGGITTRQGMQVLAHDPETTVIALISKSPDREVAQQALGWAAVCGKPVVVYLQGFDTGEQAGVEAAASLSAAAHLAVRLAASGNAPNQGGASPAVQAAPAETATEMGFLRGLFAGGTLAAETLLQLEGRLGPLYSNIPGQWRRLEDAQTSLEHTIVDLGADEFTRGRLHPMIDQLPRLERLQREAAESNVSLILLDVVLGEGAHADPAAELAPVIESALGEANSRGRSLRVVVILVGTEDDPQDLDSQVERLTAAGAVVVASVEEAVGHALALARDDDATEPMLPRARSDLVETPSEASGEPEEVEEQAVVTSVSAAAFEQPMAAVNIGLESFHDSLVSQGAASVQVDWRPPAGGNERLAGILDRLRQAGASSQAGAKTTETSGP